MEAGSARNRTASRRRAVPAPTPLRGRVFRCLFLHHQTAGRRRASRLACVIGERTHVNLVGAHLCVRPWEEAACCSGPTHRSAPTGVVELV